jgi:SAM-dependent methyltransferase
MSSEGRSERERILDAYGRRDEAGVSRAFRLSDPAFLFHIRERERALLRLLREEGFPIGSASVLEVGCGTGHVLARFLEFGARSATGVDLAPWRLREAKGQHAALRLVRADGAELPFVDGSFDLVAQFLCLSSVLDDAMRRRVAREMWRVLRPGGLLLSYDLRPATAGSRAFFLGYYALRRLAAPFRGRAGNEAAGGGDGEDPPVTPTRPVGHREIRDLFPGGSLRCEPVSLDYRLAPLAGKRPVPGRLLSAAPFLRTHYLAAVRKPVAGGKP